MYSTLLSDVVPSIPSELLGTLLYEELKEQRDRLLFSEAATGGALAFIPFSQSCSSEHGCLLYPGNQGMDRLNFHKVVLEHHEGNSSFLDVASRDPFSHQLRGPIRQISSISRFNECCVAVRSDRLCGVWRFNERNEPRLLQVVNTREVATCISTSPHVLGEILVASESGAANLWTVGKGMQKVREEDSNLYFNAKSPWRWCEFSAHPRVMVYADRTGAELTDIRVSPVSGHTLFCISKTSECRSGERLILSKYLGDVHPFHHLITTQYSAYIVDERFPCMPMLKWDHMMQSPPMFCHVIPGPSSSGSALGHSSTAKVLLGSHSSQEITLLQYSGGRAEACCSLGPPQALLTPNKSLQHLPVQIPHRMATTTSRLSSPAAGMTCIQKKRGGSECLCVVQLTEAGDIFYQILEPEQPDSSSRPPAADDKPLPQQATKKPPQPPDSQLIVTDTSSDDGIILPTQDVAMQRFVAETPEREQQAVTMFSSSSSEDSDSERRHRNLKKWLQVVVNDDSMVDQDTDGHSDVEVGRDKTGDVKQPGVVEETASGSTCLGQVFASEQHTPVKISKRALVTWRHWLQKLMQKSREKKPHPHCLQHFTVSTEGLLRLPDGEAKDSTEAQRVQSLRQDLTACMNKRSLLVHAAVSGSLVAPDVTPVPNQVETEVWGDQLSQRLTLSWQGEEVWRAWWEDQLGLNKKEKVMALRRKRRREKAEKRATGQRLELSGSFTSSISYQSELDDFSDSSGWSSTVSQDFISDTKGMGPLSQLEGFLQRTTRATTPSTVQNDTPDPTPTATPQSVKVQQGGQRTPSSSHTLSLSQTIKLDSTPASQRRSRHPADDYLSSLFATQEEPSQNIYLPEEESTKDPRPRPAAFSTTSQLCSPQPVSLRSLRVDLSQDSFVWSGFSQSPSQSSQSRPGLSQASHLSQPKRKKSRMGF
ncbi:TATA box-binding protein-associated factor RNA polymerase I subunit C isoform X2 [Anabas testudineus]|nr:TATA box-binding protein-associated factor RNA polymerase I subunit C isoform X2 [Anabas testudineus]